MSRNPFTLPVIAEAALTVETLSREREHKLAIAPDADAQAAIAALTGVEGVRDLRLEGELRPDGKAGWAFEGQLRALLDQICVVTLGPVVQEIDEPVLRRWDPSVVASAAAEEELDAADLDAPEPLGDVIDLVPVLVEALALAADPYPRAEGAALDRSVFGPEGTEPLTDEAARPFAGTRGAQGTAFRGLSPIQARRAGSRWLRRRA